jgi:hypothetical protein
MGRIVLRAVMAANDGRGKNEEKGVYMYNEGA